MYKLVIPSAGVGSRSGCAVNKALTTIGDQPMISHVIDHFPDAAEVIVILGHQGQLVKQALEAFYGKGKITFVWTDDHTKGLGHTLLAARERLHCPFIFAPNDAVVGPTERLNRDPEKVGNWVLYHPVSDGKFDITQYRTIDVQAHTIRPKGRTRGDIYTGICSVRDWEKFWAAMSTPGAVEAGEAHGLKALDFDTYYVLDWRDGGAALSLADIKKTYRSQHNVLEKPDEAIWFKDDRVVKFSTDVNFVKDRVHRVRWLSPELIPEITANSDHTYTYKKVEGRVASEVMSPEVMIRLFDVMNRELWTVDHDAENISYREFYYKKTFDRLNRFFRRDECIDRLETINGAAVPTTWDLLQGVDWLDLCDDPYVARFHGDFHNENILVREDENFTLLDWRQDFDGDLRRGDVYYDLAKFLHGLRVPHAEVASNNFEVNITAPGQVNVSIGRPVSLAETEGAFNAWVTTHGFDLRRVRVLTALIYLNIAALHTYPYSMFLYFFGKKMLAEVTA